MDKNLTKAIESFAESAQVIADALPEHLKRNQECLRIQFPWKVIRPLKSHYTRWPYLTESRKRTVACTIQLCDVNQYHLNIWKIGLTAGTMWEWHCTVPVVAVIETLAYAFGQQFDLIQDGAKFKKVINTLQSKGIINAKLREHLHSLREYRNGIHLYLQGEVEMHNGKPRRYNDAIRGLHNLERALREYCENTADKPPNQDTL